MDLKNYDSALQYGATIGAGDLASSSVTSAKIASSAVTGVKSSLTKFYSTIAVNTTGAVKVNVFGSATAPVAGTITGVFVVNSAVAAVTFNMQGTTAGTIAVIPITASGTAAYIGGVQGTNTLNAAVVAGDTVTCHTASTGGTCTAFITFQTPN